MLATIELALALAQYDQSIEKEKHERNPQNKRRRHIGPWSWLQSRNCAATNISGSPLQYLSQNILTNSYFPNVEYRGSSRISVKSNITLIGPLSEADHPGKIMSKKSQTKIGWHA